MQLLPGNHADMSTYLYSLHQDSHAGYPEFYMSKYARKAGSCHVSRKAASGRLSGGSFPVYSLWQFKLILLHPVVELDIVSHKLWTSHELTIPRLAKLLWSGYKCLDLFNIK